MLFILVNSMSGGLNSMQLNSLIIHEWVKCSNSIGTPSNTCNNNIGELSSLLEHLCLHLSTHHRLEVSNDGGEGVRSHSRSNEVVCVTDIGYPISHGFIDGILKS